MFADYTDAIAAGWRVFPLHEITPDGRCGCEQPDCAAIGKHPRTHNWQMTPAWDAEQLEYLEDPGGVFHGNQLLDGHGIALTLSRLLVVDVDGRNGGWPSAEKLQRIRDACGYIVRSGSLGGEHWYFLLPYGSPPLVTTHRDYPGIDFKSSGYVVGANSRHASGHRYESIHGSPQAITEAPAELIELLRRPERVHIEGRDIDESELARIVEQIPNETRDYERWIRVGMAIHHATGGAGYGLWLAWSAKCAAHDESTMPMKWGSFGKSSDPVTAATLIEWAREGGYTVPVTFEDDGRFDEPAVAASTSRNPPGLVGEIANWINSRCAMRREHLADAAALQIVANAACLNYLVAGRDTSLNLITIGIAGSRTGKGAIKRCIDEAHTIMGFLPAVHGKFKSSQELVRNAIHHQLVAYVYDEFGKQLQKLAGAGRAGTHYLEDLLAELIAMYSEATGVHGLSGDMKRELMDEADRRIAARCKALDIAPDENPRDVDDDALRRALRDRERAEKGIVEPCLSFFGLTEPGAFSAAVDADPWLITGGFLGRALVFEELETVPDERDDVTLDAMPETLAMRLRAIAGAGHAATKTERIERAGPWQRIQWADDAQAFLRQVRAHWRDAAFAERDRGSGLESQALGATELTIKVAGILAVDTGRIEIEHIRWAHELIKDITQDKIKRARANDQLASKNSTDRGDGLISAILRHLGRLKAGETTTVGRIRNAVGRTKISTDDVQKALDHLANIGRVSVEQKTVASGRMFAYYCIRT